MGSGIGNRSGLDEKFHGKLHDIFYPKRLNAPESAFNPDGINLR
jgi:hypothetical protein